MTILMFSSRTPGKPLRNAYAHIPRRGIPPGFNHGVYTVNVHPPPGSAGLVRRNRFMPHQPLRPGPIAAAAVAIADAEGLDAVSMRRVARELDVSAMALYRHVADRRALLLLMAETVSGNYALLPPGKHTWQKMLVHMADAQWNVFTAHPWLLSIVLTPRRLVNTASPDEVELLLATLVAAGLSEEQSFDCLLGISAAVIGTATITIAAHTGPEVAEPEGPRWDAETVARNPRAAGFQDQGISYRASRRSLDFLVANFISGVERTLNN